MGNGGISFSSYVSPLLLVFSSSGYSSGVGLFRSNTFSTTCQSST